MAHGATYEEDKLTFRQRRALKKLAPELLRQAHEALTGTVAQLRVSADELEREIVGELRAEPHREDR